MLGRISFRKRWVNGELRNILEESYYHHIEYSVFNPLATLMWKWYLNSNFQLYSYPQRLQENVDGTSIKKILTIKYTREGLRWKRGRKYKMEELHYRGEDQKNQEEIHGVTRNLSFCISLREIYKNISFSDLTDEYFSFSNCLSCSF